MQPLPAVSLEEPKTVHFLFVLSSSVSLPTAGNNTCSPVAARMTHVDQLIQGGHHLPLIYRESVEGNQNEIKIEGETGPRTEAKQKCLNNIS